MNDEDGRAGRGGARSDAGARVAVEQACDPAILESLVDELSGCNEDVHSQAVCQGIIDPDGVVRWLDHTQRLVRFKCDEEELRVELPFIAQELHALLSSVDLPPHLDPKTATEEFMRALPTIRRLISLDVVAAFEGDPAAEGAAEIVLAYPAIRALSIHRIAHVLYDLGVPLLPRIMSEYAHDRTGIDIHPGARIGERFFIDHGTGVVIGETCEIGKGVRIYQGVTLGATSIRNAKSLRGVKRHPTVEDDVTIYAGATILGGETTIGAGSVIGGNVWLTNSVPPGTRMLAEPPRQLVRDEADGETEAPKLKWDI